MGMIIPASQNVVGNRSTIWLPVHLSTYLPIHLSVHPSIHLFILPSITLLLHLSLPPYSLSIICLSIHVSIHPSLYPHRHPSLHPSVSHHPTISSSVLCISILPSIHPSVCSPTHPSIFFQPSIIHHLSLPLSFHAPIIPPIHLSTHPQFHNFCYFNTALSTSSVASMNMLGSPSSVPDLVDAELAIALRVKHSWV